ncbi:hypothetical protein NQ314_012709 [Rhamnusium bicolor]|uniref:ATP-dependent DNA helicase n=1 Tax=Rhamnusium bicolor TaxID=1586634 RepID=A0AAV8XAR0_9CUCU|nr:hypothetical protein NQ314_012709 [Rhamnusium bicolor]
MGTPTPTKRWRGPRRSDAVSSGQLRRSCQADRVPSQQQQQHQVRDLRVLLVRLDNGDRAVLSPVVGNGDGGDGERVVRVTSSARVPSPASPLPPPARADDIAPRRRLIHRTGVALAIEALEEMSRTPFFCERSNMQGVRLSCCKNGAVVVPRLQCPAEFRCLFTTYTPQHRRFLDNIRAANSLFAMASFKTSAPGRRVEGQGIESARLEPLLLRWNQFLEGRVDPDTIRMIEEALRRDNRYIGAYMTMGEVLREERDRLDSAGRAVENVVIGFRRQGDVNVRNHQYDLPESRSNIAAIFYGIDPPYELDLTLYPRVRRAGDVEGGEVLQRHELKILNLLSDPLVYPLLFPFGEDGRFPGMRHGPDCITAVAAENNEEGDRFRVDEVADYLNFRYVSSIEATWRLLELKMHDRSHSIMVFNLNRDDVNARRILYSDIPEHYTWDNREGWRPRRQVSKLIGCIADVSVRQGQMDLFLLRVLLRHVAGPTSFEELRTVDGRLYATFREACEARHLLTALDEYDRCMREAVGFRFPGQLRRRFVTIIHILDDDRLAEVVHLWRTYKDFLIEDFVDNQGMTRRQAIVRCLELMRAMLARVRPEITLEMLGIVLTDDDRDDVPVVVGGAVDAEGNLLPPVIVDDVGAVVRQRNVYDPASPNVDQKRIFMTILRCIARDRNIDLPVDLYDMMGDDLTVEELVGVRRRLLENVFFVDGPGGSGKTYLYNTLLFYINNVLRLPTIAVAWTGVAANLLIGGKTCHRAFRLPVSLDDRCIVGWPIDSWQSQYFQSAALDVWDEAPIYHRFAVEAVDRYFKELTRRPGTLMGGKCVLFDRDFRQVLPVVPRGHRASIIDASLKLSLLWHDFGKLRLHVNMRTAAGARDMERYEEFDQRTYAEWHLALGEGRLPYTSFEGRRRLPNDLIEIPRIFHSPSLQHLLDYVYGGVFDGNQVRDRAILCPTNATVDDVNSLILDRLGGEVTSYFSVDSVKEDPGDRLCIPMDLLNSVNVSGLPPHELKLKVGAVVMLLRNLDVDVGACNGARMKVTRLGDLIIECELLTGERRGQKIWLPRIKMLARDSLIPREVIQIQFPIRLAYAMTINKSQGQTLRTVGVYLRRPCFAHGQLYVAYSRVNSPDNIRVFMEIGQGRESVAARGGRKYTRNIVYHSLLEDDAAAAIRRAAPPRVIFARGDIADVADTMEAFGVQGEGDKLLEQIDISQVVRQQGDIPLDDEQRVELLSYQESDGLLIPDRSEAELRARVSTVDRPGTSGLRIPSIPLRTWYQVLPQDGGSDSSD